MNTDKRLDIKIHTTAESVEYLEQELTGTILQAAFAVHNTLGAGFLERFYSNALALELETHGLKRIAAVGIAGGMARPPS